MKRLLRVEKAKGVCQGTLGIGEQLLSFRRGLGIIISPNSYRWKK